MFVDFHAPRISFMDFLALFRVSTIFIDFLALFLYWPGRDIPGKRSRH